MAGVVTGSNHAVALLIEVLTNIYLAWVSGVTLFTR